MEEMNLFSFKLGVLFCDCSRMYGLPSQSFFEISLAIPSYVNLHRTKIPKFYVGFSYYNPLGIRKKLKFSFKYMDRTILSLFGHKKAIEISWLPFNLLIGWQPITASKADEKLMVSFMKQNVRQK